ncbi:MAG: HNH endonuclease [Chloroflexi bacterium]|nr:HNH endonuclease [Chloroflexota bacterium]
MTPRPFLPTDVGFPARRLAVGRHNPGLTAPAARTESTIQRVIRTTEFTRRIKDLYNHQCQICGVRLDTAAGTYAEGAHIRPLGRPHNGLDELDNLLCLCPNHHLLLDRGGITINHDFLVQDYFDRDAPWPLTVVPGHKPNRAHLAYHWRLFRWSPSKE